MASFALTTFAFQPIRLKNELKQRHQNQAQTRQPIRSLSLKKKSLRIIDKDGEPKSVQDRDGSISATLAISSVAILYWLYLVFGAAASQAGVPMPDFIPMTPGWPPSDADLAPALEDSAHFFYIKDIINHYTGVVDEAQPPVVRLAVFNFAEAWVFSFLPVLLADKRRLSLPVVLSIWVGALGLTNAFLAPYLAVREGIVSQEKTNDRKGGRDGLLSISVGVIAAGVSAYAILSMATSSSLQDWLDFATLASEDRTYQAFCVDLVLFSIFQTFLLDKVYHQEHDDSLPQLFKIPFVGLMAWLFGVTVQ